MANLNIKFNNKNYSIDPASLANALASLEAHLVAMMGGSGDSVVGTWVFNDEITIPSELYDKTIDVNFTSNNTEGDKAVFDTMYFWDDGCGLSYYGDTDGVEEAYYVDNGWYEGCKTITITEQPTDPEFIAWLKANATKIKIENVVGAWYLNDELTPAPIDAKFKFNSVGATWDWIYNYYDADGVYLVYRTADRSSEYEVYEDGYWYDERCRTIGIFEQPNDIGFILWLKENATRINTPLEEFREVGLYDVEGNMSKTWNELIADGTVIVSNATLKTPFDESTLKSLSKDALVGHLVIAFDVTEIFDYAFTACSYLTGATIPDGVTYIGAAAFDSTGLTNIKIPTSVTRIGIHAFYYCLSLTNIVFEGTIEQWNAITKGNKWNFNVPATHVHCTDGDVAL